MLKSSRWILERAGQDRMIEPFVDRSVRSGVVSFGLGPYGYDLRLDRAYRRPAPGLAVLDPHRVRDGDFSVQEADEITLPPGEYLLGKSLEYFRIPKKILGLVFGKSTYARCGVLVNVTPLEPEWSGFLTISIANTGRLPVVLHAGEGIAQVVFLESDDLPVYTYRELGGKYDQQDGIAVARIDR